MKERKRTLTVQRRADGPFDLSVRTERLLASSMLGDEGVHDGFQTVQTGADVHFNSLVECLDHRLLHLGEMLAYTLHGANKPLRFLCTWDPFKGGGGTGRMNRQNGLDIHRREIRNGRGGSGRRGRAIPLRCGRCSGDDWDDD